MDETPADITVRIARENAYDEGWLAGRDDERETWNRIIGAYNDVVDMPTRAVRRQLRNDQCGSRCRACSRCVRAALVARNGGDYSGGPVTPW